MGAHSQEELGVAAVHGPVEDDEPVRLVTRQEGRKEVPLAPGHNLNRVGEHGGGLGLAHHSDVPQGQNLLQEGAWEKRNSGGGAGSVEHQWPSNSTVIHVEKGLRDLPRVEQVNTCRSSNLHYPRPAEASPEPSNCGV
jgi:hypothetical protein